MPKIFKFVISIGWNGTKQYIYHIMIECKVFEKKK